MKHEGNAARGMVDWLLVSLALWALAIAAWWWL